MKRNPVTAFAESRTQEAIFAYLRRALPSDYRAFSVPNGAHMGQRNAVRMKREGMTPGVPDIIVARNNGTHAYLEVKADKGKLSEPQAEWGEWASSGGGEWAVVRSIADTEAALRAWGVPLKARAS